MNFYNKAFLLSHCQEILNFYTDKVVDKTGGYHQNYLDDGTLFNTSFKQLVSSTRIIVNYALAGMVFDRQSYLDIARHGLDYLEQVHWQESTRTYAWTLENHQPLDMTQQAYGYAFVLLAYASVLKAGIINSDVKLQQVWELLEERFWQPEYGLYADELSPDGVLSSYRGQNANMHLCEAMIAAYEATGKAHFLDRAQTLASNIAVRQANLTQGLIWEHYTDTFDIDWEYNKDDPRNLYRPWGFQPGHQTEWTKLLLQLNRHAPESWLVDRAKALFHDAWEHAWDDEYQGLVYGFSPDGDWCDDEKYFWVQAESLAAAALLHEVTDEPVWLERYTKLWQYSWDYMVDHTYGAWYRLLLRNNTKFSSEKSAAGAKCDYHTLGACFEVLHSLERLQTTQSEQA